MTKPWDINLAREQYALGAWGSPYFDISAAGELLVRPDGDGDGVALAAVVQQSMQQGLRLPLLLRFPQILAHRVRRLQAAFSNAMSQQGYEAAYTPVYPIKVNQQRSVVRTLAGQDGVGLEAGSKPELIAVLAHAKSGSVVVCNGYKDAEYIRLALMGEQLGLQIYLVIEKANELKLILREAKKLGITPRLGLRLRLVSLGAGKWQNTGGERAKFGLSPAQVLEAVEMLRREGLLDRLQLLHFHMGSQISNIRHIAKGVAEAGRYLVALSQAGVAIQVLDIGGGLGIDYEGTRSRAFCSMNYTLEQYAGVIVETLNRICEDNQITKPDLVSESGRALTAHHAVLVSNVSAVESVLDVLPPPIDPGEQDSPAIHQLQAILDHIGTAAAGADGARASLQEQYLEAVHYYEAGADDFLAGQMSLPQRAALDALYRQILLRLSQLLDHGRRQDVEISERIREKLTCRYFVNLSIFRSLPDIWAIDQIFPVMPLARLDQAPRRRAVIEDLTCDSDGRIDYYVDGAGVAPDLAVHEIQPGENYLLGFFLAGAYQETLGDIHNLFGDTDSVNVTMEQGEAHLSSPRAGDGADDLLQMVGYQRRELLGLIRNKVAASPLDADSKQLLSDALQAGLDGYTYLELD